MTPDINWAFYLFTFDVMSPLAMVVGGATGACERMTNGSTPLPPDLVQESGLSRASLVPSALLDKDMRWPLELFLQHERTVISFFSSCMEF